MIDKNFLPNVFDIFFESSISSRPPNYKSINKINSHFGICLPHTFIDFCRKSKYYSNWFCSIGDDYEDLNHIIRTNSQYKNIRRRVGKKSIYYNVRMSSGHQWSSIKSKNWLLIRAGHDDHCLIMKTSNASENGEFEIQYWDPGYDIEFRDAYPDFLTYMESLLEYMIGHASKKELIACKKYIKNKVM